MTEPKFTPGPWRFVESPPREVTLKRRHWVVGQAEPPVKGVGFAFGENDANARLIAAAPDLYAALEQCETVMMIVQPRSHTKEHLACLDQARDALAKARGEQ